MNALIQITTDEQGSLVVASTDFAAGLEIQHKNLLETIRTQQELIERDFGPIAFETRLPEPNIGGHSKTIAYLTEDQALFIGTLSRNSKRVVEFKSVLVQSFAKARQHLLNQATPPPSPVFNQALMQLLAQSNQLLADQQQRLVTHDELLTKLRTEVDDIHAEKRQRVSVTTDQRSPNPRRRIRHGDDHKKNKPAHLPGLPGLPVGAAAPTTNGELRKAIHHHVADYSAYYGATVAQTYGYLYKRMFEVHGLSVHRLNRAPTESLLDVLERYGELNRLHSLAVNELTYPHE